MPTTECELALVDIEKALKSANAQYRIDGDTILLGMDPVGQVEINVPGDGIFEDDIVLLNGRATENPRVDFIAGELRRATMMVCVQPIWTFGFDKTLQALEPLFDWLLADYPGVLADEGGTFFSADGPIE